MNKKQTNSFKKYFLLSLCSCAVYGLWFCAPHREFLFIMFHHGTRGKAEDRTFLELRLQTVSLVGNLLTPVTSNVLFRYSMHICIQHNQLWTFANLLVFNTLYLFSSLFAFLA